MPPACGHTVHRTVHPGSPPLRYEDKDSPCCFAPGKVLTSSSPRSRIPRVRKALDRFFEDVARAEGRNLLGCDLHLLTRLRVPALPGLSLPHGELAEACDLDLPASLESFGHYLLEGIEVLLC